MGGALFARLLQELAIPLDGVTFCLGLWNFGVVGVLGTFWLPLPLRLKQGYLVFIGAVTALWFTHLPELTTWGALTRRVCVRARVCCRARGQPGSCAL